MCRWLKDYFNSRSYVKNEFEKIQKTYSENLSPIEMRKLSIQIETLMPILNKKQLEETKEIRKGLLTQMAMEFTQEIARQKESDITMNFDRMLSQYLP